MKTTMILEADGKKISLDLGYENVASIVSGLSESDDNAEILSVLAKHPSVAVREAVAYKDKLNEDTVMLLAADSEVSVLNRVLRSDKARDCLSTELLLAIIIRDVEASETIASGIGDFKSADVDEVSAALLKHPDPRVRNALAGNSSAPKKILKALLKDVDCSVVASAKSSLE